MSTGYPSGETKAQADEERFDMPDEPVSECLPGHRSDIATCSSSVGKTDRYAPS